MLAKSCHGPDIARERDGRVKKRVQTQTSYFSSFPSLPNINQMQCWVLARGMKRQKSPPSDDELTTSEVSPHLASAVQVVSHPQGTGLAMARDKVTQVPTSCTMGPTGTQPPRPACTQMRICTPWCAKTSANAQTFCWIGRGLPVD